LNLPRSRGIDLAMRALVLLAVVGCGSSPPPAAVRGERGVVLDRGTPAPVIAWHGGAFALTGLPAIARGGEVVVVAMVEGDGGRGNPSLRIDVRDRSDKLQQSIPVMTAAEAETMVKDGVPAPALQERIASANRELFALHGLHDLVAMHALELQSTDGDRHLAIGDGLDIDWDNDHLHVFHHNANHALVTLDGTPWLVREHKACPECEPCNHAAFLAGVYHAPDINTVVVDIGYRGTDTCTEPGDQQHVVVW
jgi:hypothetical protein